MASARGRLAADAWRCAVKRQSAASGFFRPLLDRGFLLRDFREPSATPKDVKKSEQLGIPGVEAHEACRQDLRGSSLPPPVSRCVTTSGLREISDPAVAYNAGGTFVLHVRERFGLFDGAPLL
jgi:hypothetical protein